MTAQTDPRDTVAVIGSGITGLSAAWLLAKRHRVTLYEADPRLGGHSNTVDVDGTSVDTGFIVFNEDTYPNLKALFQCFGVATRPTEMSFSVSLDEGRLEYSGSGLRGLFAQGRNTVSPRFWAMLRDLLRFYRDAPKGLAALGSVSLDDYLAAAGYGAAFRDDHLYPMAAAIWSTPAIEIGRYPAAAFIRFCDNHGLLKLAGRPTWRTVAGGSGRYVEHLAAAIAGRIVTGRRIARIDRFCDHVVLVDEHGREDRFDHVVVAAHADQALAMLAEPTPDERRLLGAFRYTRNEAVLHNDPRLMPMRRQTWSSWNYLSAGSSESRRLSVTYWMNRLQGLSTPTPLFVTLNPLHEPKQGSVIWSGAYQHPAFDADAIEAQAKLWLLQGVRRTWFCGSYFGAGFHEDGLQAGLAVAEALGGVRRPWTVEDESGRIGLPTGASASPLREFAPR